MIVAGEQGIQLLCVVSGGQTGVDRAALDCAIANGIQHGGWCPAGRLAEDGVIPSCYTLTETGSADYQVRTRLNVQESDGTLILAGLPLEGGTALTAQMAEKLQKPLLVVDPLNGDSATVRVWLANNSVSTLNVAGPRASKQPEIYDRAYRFLDRLFKMLRA